MKILAWVLSKASFLSSLEKALKRQPSHQLSLQIYALLLEAEAFDEQGKLDESHKVWGKVYAMALQVCIGSRPLAVPVAGSASPFGCARAEHIHRRGLVEARLVVVRHRR